MIKRILFPTLLALAATASFAKADATIENKFEVGSKLNYKFEMKMQVAGMDVSLKASPVLTVKSVKDGVATIDHTFKDIKLMLGENEQEEKFDPIVVEKKMSG